MINLATIFYIIFVISIEGFETNIENFYLLIFLYIFFFFKKVLSFFMRLKLRNYILKNTSFNLRKYRKIRNKFFIFQKEEKNKNNRNEMV